MCGQRIIKGGCRGEGRHRTAKLVALLRAGQRASDRIQESPHVHYAPAATFASGVKLATLEDWMRIKVESNSAKAVAPNGS